MKLEVTFDCNCHERGALCWHVFILHDMQCCDLDMVLSGVPKWTDSPEHTHETDRSLPCDTDDCCVFDDGTMWQRCTETCRPVACLETSPEVYRDHEANKPVIRSHHTDVEKLAILRRRAGLRKHAESDGRHARRMALDKIQKKAERIKKRARQAAKERVEKWKRKAVAVLPAVKL